MFHGLCHWEPVFGSSRFGRFVRSEGVSKLHASVSGRNFVAPTAGVEGPGRSDRLHPNVSQARTICKDDFISESRGAKDNLVDSRITSQSLLSFLFSCQGFQSITFKQFIGVPT